MKTTVQSNFDIHFPCVIHKQLLLLILHYIFVYFFWNKFIKCWNWQMWYEGRLISTNYPSHYVKQTSILVLFKMFRLFLINFRTFTYLIANWILFQDCFNVLYNIRYFFRDNQEILTYFNYNRIFCPRRVYPTLLSFLCLYVYNKLKICGKYKSFRSITNRKKSNWCNWNNFKFVK